LDEKFGKEQIPDVNFDDIWDLLAAESLAMAMFCVTGRGTLTLVLDPKEKEPQCVFVDLTEAELKTLIPAELDSEEWNKALFQALPTLSKKLGPPLREVMKHCATLYLVPDSRLYFVPFAALTFDHGSRLIEHCALAYAPSAAVLRWCRSRRTKSVERTCLALGVGSAGDGQKSISFAEQTRNIVAEQKWTKLKLLLDDEATVQRFLDEAPHFTALHLSCHGRVEASKPGALSASYLELHGHMPLSAKAVFALNGQLQAELVFLNACLSGRFQSEIGSEVGGFWEAFLHAGAASLVATLTYVDPGPAQQLAQNFYQRWLSKNLTKAEALRQVQLLMHRQNIPPSHWASHILIGDYG
jgi:CHAT domain-containing protein